MIDDNQKMFIPHLAIDNDFFLSAFVNPCSLSTTQELVLPRVDWGADRKDAALHSMM